MWYQTTYKHVGFWRRKSFCRKLIFRLIKWWKKSSLKQKSEPSKFWQVDIIVSNSPSFSSVSWLTIKMLKIIWKQSFHMFNSNFNTFSCSVFSSFYFKLPCARFIFNDFFHNYFFAHRGINYYAFQAQVGLLF